MTYLASGTAIEAVVDAVKIALEADATLTGLVTGIYGHVPGAARTAYPYLRIGHASLLPDEYGGMQTGGGLVQFVIDGWSDAKGAHTIRTILARVRVVLDRANPAVAQHRLAGDSLHCTREEVFDEPDPDMPEARLYHGHQDWDALVEEA